MQSGRNPTDLLIIGEVMSVMNCLLAIQANIGLYLYNSSSLSPFIWNCTSDRFQDFFLTFSKCSLFVHHHSLFSTEWLPIPLGGNSILGPCPKSSISSILGGYYLIFHIKESRLEAQRCRKETALKCNNKQNCALLLPAKCLPWQLPILLMPTYTAV